MADKPENVKPESEWSTPIKIPEGDPPISHDDSTPPIVEQAKANGWTAAYYDFGKAEQSGIECFNPAIVERQDGLWLLVRRSEPHPQGFQFGQNDVWAFMLDETGKVPKMGKRLRWMNHEASQHFEDPRGFYHPRINQTLIGACTFVWYPNQPWTGAHQCFGAFDENWVCQKMDYPRIGGNPGEMKRIEKHENYEKNWLWWLHDDKLHLLYKAHPWIVYQFGKTWSDFVPWKVEEGAKWAYGDIRGGTTPVRVGDYYFTFHHSSLPWKGRYRRYYAGCLAFDVKPPFRPLMITPEPILRGSQQDVWTQRKPLVVFPCGSLYRDGQWLLTLGVNDMKAAWMELPHESLLARMKPIGDYVPIFSESGLSDGEKQANLSGGASSSEALAGIQNRVEPASPSAQTTLESGLSSGEQMVREDYIKASEEVKNERLEKLRANLVKARAARAAKRLSETYKVVKSDITFNHTREAIKVKKRRRKRRTRKILQDA